MVLSLPFLLTLTWGIVAYVVLNKLYGLSVIFVVNALLLVFFAVYHWKYSAWRLDWWSRTSMLTAVVMVFTFLLWVVFLIRPYSFIGVSAVFLAFNMIPMVHLTYVFT